MFFEISLLKVQAAKTALNNNNNKYSQGSLEVDSDFGYLYPDNIFLRNWNIIAIIPNVQTSIKVVKKTFLLFLR